MLEVLEVIKNRRSTRQFLSTPVEQVKIDTIIEAGKYAASGGNSHSTHIYVIQDESVLSELRKKVMKEFSRMEIEENTYASIKNSINRSKAGSYDFCYGAPCLIVLTNKKGYGNAMADCACMIENMMLQASAMGIGNCYINQLHWLEDKPAIRKFLQISDEETICCSLALGYSDDVFAAEHMPGKEKVTTITASSLLLAKFMDKEGVITQYPSMKQQEARVLVLDYAASKFEMDVTYNEAQVNTILKKVYPADYVLLRRELIETHRLERTNTGSEYHKC